MWSIMFTTSNIFTLKVNRSRFRIKILGVSHCSGLRNCPDQRRPVMWRRNRDMNGPLCEWRMSGRSARNASRFPFHFTSRSWLYRFTKAFSCGHCACRQETNTSPSLVERRDKNPSVPSILTPAKGSCVSRLLLCIGLWLGTQWTSRSNLLLCLVFTWFFSSTYIPTGFHVTYIMDISCNF